MSQSTINRSNQEDAQRDENLIPESNLHVEISSAEGIHEVDLGNSHTYSQTVPRLEDIATLLVVLPLCHIFEMINWQNYSSYITGERRIRKMNEVFNQLNVPKSILNKLKCVGYVIQAHLDNWKDFSTATRPQDMYFTSLREICDCKQVQSDRYETFLPRWNKYVWKPNGFIDYRRTALKILSCHEKCDSRTNIMFQIMASFCLENYLNEFPTDLLSKEFIQQYHYSKIIEYWIERKKNSPNLTLVHATLLDTLKNVTHPEMEWSVYDYFWNSFDESEQIVIARKLISTKGFLIHQMELFSKLNRSQLRILYSKEPIQILLNFIYTREIAMVRATWRCIRHSISGPQFEEILDTVSDKAKKTGDYVDLLIDIWNSAPPALIEYMLIVKKREIVDNFFRIYGGDQFMLSVYHHFIIVAESLRFLAAILSKVETEITKTYLVLKGPFLICEYDTNVFNSIMQSALSITDQQEVKENVLLKIVSLEPSHTLRYFKKLITEKREKLDEFVSFFTTKHELQIQLKRKLIPSSLFELNNGYFNIDDWSKVSNLVDEVYPDEKRSRKKKRKILFSTLTTENTTKSPFELCFRRNGDERYDELDQILKSTVPENDVVKFKGQIINDFRARFFKDEFINGFRAKIFSSHCPALMYIRMDNFVHWCFSGDIVKVSRFKSRFPLHKIFHIIFCEIVRVYAGYFSTGKVSFAPLDVLLCWKFPSESQRSQFKEKYILDIVNDTKTAYLWRDYDDELEVIIRWIFDDNELKIRQFNKTYGVKQQKKIIYASQVEEISDGCEEYYNYHSDASSD